VVTAAGGHPLAQGVKHIVDRHIHEHLAAGAHKVVLDRHHLGGVIVAGPQAGVELSRHDAADVEHQIGVAHQIAHRIRR